MTGFLSPRERRIRTCRRAIVGAAILAGFVVMTLLDETIVTRIGTPRVGPLGQTAADEVERQDWYRLMRLPGYLPFWGVFGAALLGAGRARARLRGDRGIPLRFVRVALVPFVAAVLAGMTAELLKLSIARERPLDGTGAYQGYVFRGVFGGFADGSGLGFPSSHTAVAVAGCAAVARLVAGTWWALLVVAAGCALSRVLTGAHFATDVYGAAVVGYAWARLLTPRHGRRDQPWLFPEDDWSERSMR